MGLTDYLQGLDQATVTGKSKDDLLELAVSHTEVLVVDDEELILDLGKEVLESKGYTVVTAADGQLAKDYLTAAYDASSDVSTIDFLWTDGDMPYATGDKVIAHALSHGLTAEQTVLATGNPGTYQSLIPPGTVLVPKPCSNTEYNRVTDHVASRLDARIADLTGQ